MAVGFEGSAHLVESYLSSLLKIFDEHSGSNMRQTADTGLKLNLLDASVLGSAAAVEPMKAALQ